METPAHHDHAAWKELRIAFQAAHPESTTDLLDRAYAVAHEAHRGQKRITGEEYIVHPLGTALYLAQRRYDAETIIAALLHDVLEDTPVTMTELTAQFGETIAKLVEGATVLEKIKFRGVDRYIENLRKMFIAMAHDLRVIFIKCADRIDNLKTLHVWPREKQIRIARETIEIYAPIANRLGLGECKGDLEDLAFAYLDPTAFAWTKNLIAVTAPKRARYLKTVQERIAEEMATQGMTPVDIHGRTKRLYSLYQKLLRHDRDIHRVYDFIALRIIVRNIPECYAVLGIIHALWRPLKGRIKDYIATPKPNGYQSLHTTVFCDDGEIVEFQIRTEDMHDNSEFGVAGHWRSASKQPLGKKRTKDDGEREADWVRALTTWHKNIRANEEKISSLKLDVFQNRIFVFTPQGEIVDLPDGATPVDFAYAIHTKLGDQCAFSFVNNIKVPLDTTVKSGDVVEIIIDKKKKGPSAEWLGFVKTNRARSKIKERLRARHISVVTQEMPQVS